MSYSNLKSRKSRGIVLQKGRQNQRNRRRVHFYQCPGARGKIKVCLHRAGAAGKRGIVPLSRGVGINLTFGSGSGSWLRGRQALFMRRQ
ncbi:hypothetical protein NPIL_202671 [Nephila pilipes]|uniref:Uncharacterized protein n=1 Tax=Nephila pilipes TaxID=299642 RepID=A0A8X6UX36_NEPPI|nr:hypothetical protein NPIL_202671 [Nephila pilipes]